MRRHRAAVDDGYRALAGEAFESSSGSTGISAVCNQRLRRRLGQHSWCCCPQGPIARHPWRSIALTGSVVLLSIITIWLCERSNGASSLYPADVTSLAAARHAQVSAAGCSHITIGTCILFPCETWLGNTTCVGSRCYCHPGLCVNDFGVCANEEETSCRKHTGFSCNVLPCNAELNAVCRGPFLSKRCMCRPGDCASVAGRCSPRGSCSKDTGQTCNLLPCEGSLRSTMCRRGKCMCKEGFCAVDSGAGLGECVLPPELKLKAKGYAVNQNHPEFPDPHGSIATGLAFSGGGARALSAAMGAIRGLEHLDLMTGVDAISAVSGGSWAAAIYTFADMDIESLVGAPTEPENLSMDMLKMDVGAMGATMTKFPTLVQALATGLNWVEFLSKTVLKPFGLEGTRLMAASESDVHRIKEQNPSLRAFDFVVPMTHRPKVLIIGAALEAPLGYQATHDSVVSLQMSPDISGCPFWPNNTTITYNSSEIAGAKKSLTLLVGGGFIESFAFGSPHPEVGQDQSGWMNLTPPLAPFTLENAIGMSSFGPASKVTDFGLGQYWLPRVDIWPFMQSSGTGQEERKFQVGDGGGLENLGLLPLLQRGAKSVVLFVNSMTALGGDGPEDVDFCSTDPTVDWAAKFPSSPSATRIVDTNLQSFFGYEYVYDEWFYYNKNQVFPKADALPYLCALQSEKRAGRPAVSLTTHRVLENSWWGIRGGYNVTLLTFYLEQVADFEAQLPVDTRNALGSSRQAARQGGEFAHFPLLSTFTERSYLNPFSLSPREVNLLAAQVEYSVRHSAGLSRDMLASRPARRD